MTRTEYNEIKTLITMIQINHVSACDFAKYDRLGLIPDDNDAKIMHLQRLMIDALESGLVDA
jgi:hypothetical protein